MQKPIEIYNQQKKELEHRADKLKKKLINLAVVRFVVFALIGVLVYFTFGEYPLVFIITILGLSLFSFLVMKYINIKRDKLIVDEKIELNSLEIDVLNRKFHHLETGEEFADTTHFYSNDIDLFGKGSFFQYANRTTTLDGKKELANLLTSNTINAITDKQSAVNELRSEEAHV